MGIRNYLIEGGSGTGKTSVCEELLRRGYHAIHGDRKLAYQGDPATGIPIDGFASLNDEDRARFTSQHLAPLDDNARVRFISEHHIWHVDKVRTLVADQTEAVTFFCGGSRNVSSFIALFDAVFILDIDLDTLNQRLDQRAEDAWGSRQSERDFIVHLHRTKGGVPSSGIIIDATAPLAKVVDEILRHYEADQQLPPLESSPVSGS